jgi:hypothetical protein
VTLAIFLLVIVVAIVAVVVAAVGIRPRARSRGGWWWSRGQNIKQAASEDVEVIRRDRKDVAPDAPGNHFDEL